MDSICLGKSRVWATLFWGRGGGGSLFHSDTCLSPPLWVASPTRFPVEAPFREPGYSKPYRLLWGGMGSVNGLTSLPGQEPYSVFPSSGTLSEENQMIIKEISRTHLKCHFTKNITLQYFIRTIFITFK